MALRRLRAAACCAGQWLRENSVPQNPCLVMRELPKRFGCGRVSRPGHATGHEIILDICRCQRKCYWTCARLSGQDGERGVLKC